MESIQTVRYTVEAKDTYTRGHSDRVSEYSVLIGKKLGLPDEDIRRLQIGGLFHDVGKIGIPENIINKEGKLTDEEFWISIFADDYYSDIHGDLTVENIIYSEEYPKKYYPIS